MVGVGGRSYATRCHVCRRRKVKCDGQKPSCQRCEKAGLTCTGYERSLEYSHFDGKSMVKSDSVIPNKTGTVPTNLYQSLQRGHDGVESLRRGYGPTDSFTNLFPMHRVMDQSLTAPQYKVGFVSVFQDRYVPDLLKPLNGQGEGICSGWIATACELSSLNGSGMLSDSLLAMSLALVGGDRNDQDMATAGLRHYSRALNKLRVELQPGPLALDQFQMDVSLVTCLACATYEMIAHQSFDSLVQHLQGVRGLFTAWGVGNLRSKTSRRIFYEYRVIEMTVSLATRRVSFLSLPEWLNPPWKKYDSHSSNPLQTLIDSAILLPALMEYWDRSRRSAPLARVDNKIDTHIANNFVQDALGIQRAINDWEANLRGGDDKSQLYIAHLATMKDSSEAENSGRVWPISYTFPNFEIAAALMYFETVHIFLYGLLIEMIICVENGEDLDPKDSGIAGHSLNIEELTTKSLECADRICQSLEYFFERDKRMIGRIVILSPFEAVRGLFARLHQTGTGDVNRDVSLAQKLRFCDEIAQRIKAEGLLIWDGPGSNWGSVAYETMSNFGKPEARSKQH